jgi:plasmid stabilization system protein ParE
VRVEFLHSAYRDLERLHDFLESKNPDAADRASETLFEAAVSLEKTPKKGRPITGNLRDCIVPFGNAAYIMRYRLDERRQLVLITRIWHSRERRS